MSFFKVIIITAMSIIPVLLQAQQDFDDIYNSSDPAYGIIDKELKQSIHQAYLDSVKIEQDTMKIIFGSLYLANDMIIESNYTTAMELLIQANKNALALKDTLLLGRISHKKGAVYTALYHNEKAVENYTAALEFNQIAQDSYYIAITMEQLGRKYAENGDFKTSNDFYDRAIPMVQKFCSVNSLSLTLTNYGNSLSEQGEIDKAIYYYKKAIKVAKEESIVSKIVLGKLNLAILYLNNDSLDKSLVLYENCREIGEQEKLGEDLIHIYKGISIIYEEKNQTDSAYKYFQKHIHLKDSIIGTEVNNEINELESSAVLEEHESKVTLLSEENLTQKSKFTTIIIFVLILVFLVGLGMFFYFKKSNKEKRRLKKNQKLLRETISNLASKNEELRNRKEIEIAQNKEEGHESIDIYEMTILTEEDWQHFKQLFHKSYPEFLHNVRFNYPDISPAEERLFMFIKLNVTYKEAANILGVQVDTIKKTRYRLKKRLQLGKEDNVKEFVQNFN